MGSVRFAVAELAFEFSDADFLANEDPAEGEADDHQREEDPLRSTGKDLHDEDEASTGGRKHGSDGQNLDEPSEEQEPGFSI